METTGILEFPLELDGIKERRTLIGEGRERVIPNGNLANFPLITRISDDNRNAVVKNLKFDSSLLKLPLF